MVNTPYSENTLQELLQQFKVEAVSYRFKGIKQGYINDSFFVLHKDAIKFVLQRINTGVFTNPKRVMENISTALPYLHGEDYVGIDLIATHDQRNYIYSPQMGYWRLYRYIPNSYAPAVVANAEMAFEAGKLLGNFHGLGALIPQGGIQEIIPKFHDLQWRVDQFKTSLSKATQVSLHAAKDSIAMAKATFSYFTPLWEEEMPLRICHNDAKLNNMLFDQSTNTSLCFIDLDTLMLGHFYYDFGDAVRTIVNATPEDETNLDLITFDKALFDHFLNGLVQTNAAISPYEKETLHLGILYMPFLHGLRALTDYLEGNIYYKVAYENQNLDRCRNLFRFVEVALAAMETIKDMIKRKL
ncbi:phosphotransferase enzyme family protein [Spongiimicrobium salis]|uniref:phosphotransferase enzyme family protein n=1 Tax=Spongiimicrobium salis TaxID=1667022 RepID=UPI00374DDE33